MVGAPSSVESCMSGWLWQVERIWSALIIENPGIWAISAPEAALPEDDVPDDVPLLPAAVVEPVVSLVPDEPEVPASAVVDEEPDELEPEVPASAVVEPEPDDPVVLPDDPASAEVPEEPEPVVAPEPVVEFMALELPEAALRPLR